LLCVVIENLGDGTHDRMASVMLDVCMEDDSF
jgi:hypothetical protein